MSEEKKKKVKRYPRKQRAAFPPPPMLVEPQKTVFGAETYVSTATIEPASEEEAPAQAINWLRQLAEVNYVTNQEGITIAQIHKDPRFNHLSNTTIYRWSYEDKWVDKRRDYFERLKFQLEQKIANALVRAQYIQLQDMDGLSENIKHKLRNSDIPVKSFEGLVKALLGVEEFRRSERIRLASDVVPESLGGEGLAINQVVPDLSEDEARKLATEIMQMRQKKTREKLKPTEEDLDEDDGEPLD